MEIDRVSHPITLQFTRIWFIQL